MCDNRTSEFLAIAQKVPAATADRLPSISTPTTQQQQQQRKQNDSAANPAFAQLRNFHSTAAAISRDIASTSALLAQLTELVRHGSFGNEQDPQMNQLVVRIKSNIENLNSRLDQASLAIKQQKRQMGQQAGQEATNMVDGLQTVFAQAASDFKKVLEQRTESIKEQTDFQKQVYDYQDDDDSDNPMPNMGALNAAPPPVYSAMNNSQNNGFPTLDLTSSLMMEPGQATGSALPRPHGIAYTGNGSDLRQRRPESAPYSGGYGDGSHTPLTPLDIQRMEQEMGMQQQLIPDQDYLQQRANAMSTVESNIVELGTIYNKLAVMVSEHADMVQRVDDNVQDAHTNINLSLDVLTDTLTSLKTNRMLALRVFSVLVVFIIAFIIFFA